MYRSIVAYPRIDSADCIAVRRTRDWTHGAATHGFELIDIRTDVAIWRGHGFMNEASRDDAVGIAKRAVLGLRPSNSQAYCTVQAALMARAWASRHWGPV